MLRWISEHCREKSLSSVEKDLRRYVLFIDDDYFLDVEHLSRFLSEIDSNENLRKNDRRTFLTGYVYKESRPRRFLNDRWFISIDDYPYDRYPPYVTAGCFLMSRSNARLFSLASQYLPLFRFDDIYIGLLAYSMSIGIVENNHLFSSYSTSAASLLNGKNSSNRTDLIFRFQRWWNSLGLGQGNDTSLEPLCLHGFRGNELIQLWNHIYRSNLSLVQRS